MVDITAKTETFRKAKAAGIVQMDIRTLELIEKGQIAKGNVLTTAKIAGIMAAKKTGELIPLCHPLQINKVDVLLIPDEKGIICQSTVRCIGPTGVEMEALTAVSVALLTVYDMCKAVDKNMHLGNIRLIEKTKKDIPV